MQVLKVVQRMAGTDAEGLTEKITAATARLADLRADLARVESEKQNVDDQARFHQLCADAAWIESRIRVVEARELPELQEKLSTAKAVRQRDAIVRHRKAAVAAFGELKTALEKAVEANDRALAVFVAAQAELGEIAQREIPHIAHPLLARGLFQTFIRERERTIGALTRPATPKPAPAPVAKPMPTPEPARASLQHRVTLADDPPPVVEKPAPIPDDQSPLQPGEVRAHVLRPGYPDQSGRRRSVGAIIRLPRAKALKAETNGGVEIIEGDTP